MLVYFFFSCCGRLLSCSYPDTPCAAKKEDRYEKCVVRLWPTNRIVSIFGSSYLAGFGGFPSSLCAEGCSHCPAVETLRGRIWYLVDILNVGFCCSIFRLLAIVLGYSRARLLPTNARVPLLLLLVQFCNRLEYSTSLLRFAPLELRTH